MKKLILYGIMIVLGISLTGCGSNSKGNESGDDSANQNQVSEENNDNSSNNDKGSVKLEKNELIELTNEKVAVHYTALTVRSLEKIRGDFYHIEDNAINQDTLIFEIMDDEKNPDNDLNKETKIFITTGSIEKNSVKLEDISNNLLDLRNRVTKLSFALPDTENYGDWAFTESKEKIQGRDTIIQEGTLSCFGKVYSNYVAYEFYLHDGTICEVFVASPFYESDKLREAAEIMISTFEEQQQSAYN